MLPFISNVYEFSLFFFCKKTNFYSVFIYYLLSIFSLTKCFKMYHFRIFFSLYFQWNKRGSGCSFSSNYVYPCVATSFCWFNLTVVFNQFSIFMTKHQHNRAPHGSGTLTHIQYITWFLCTCNCYRCFSDIAKTYIGSFLLIHFQLLHVIITLGTISYIAIMFTRQPQCVAHKWATLWN